MIDLAAIKKRVAAGAGPYLAVAADQQAYDDRAALCDELEETRADLANAARFSWVPPEELATLRRERDEALAALADKALVLERYAALRDKNEALSEELSEARGVAREVASGTMHPVDRERYFAQWTAQAKAEAEKRGDS